MHANTQSFYGASHVAKRPAWPTPPPPVRGTPEHGRIATLAVGRGHGFIRLRDHRKVFFHRVDVLEGKPFSTFQIGDCVAFELIDDPVSGPRAMQVTPSPDQRD